MVHMRLTPPNTQPKTTIARDQSGRLIGCRGSVRTLSLSRLQRPMYEVSGRDMKNSVWKDVPQEALEATGGSQGQMREIVWYTYTLTINVLRGKVRQLELRAEGHWSYSPYRSLQEDRRLPPFTVYVHDEKTMKTEHGKRTYLTT